MFPWSFRNAGIMGINARNLDYIFRENKRRFYQRVDDKVLTKKLAMEAGIAVPTLISVIEFQNQARHLRTIIGGRKAFALKPAAGSGGGGIIIVHDVTPTGYRTSSGNIISESALRYHMSNILSGMYAMGGQIDKVLLEDCVFFDSAFDDISYKGVPDIRVIVYQGVPAMAMLRLPTAASDGKANLHMGGIGVGIAMATGTTKLGIQKGVFTSEHPETGHRLEGRVIPYWRDILSIASRFFDVTEMGYLGVDIVLDKDRGPLVLEANARPGISIQVANRCGLLPRLQKIHAALPTLRTIDDKVDFALQHLENA
jgi:alpha-L-glutamate ligase-like protein